MIKIGDSVVKRFNAILSGAALGLASHDAIKKGKQVNLRTVNRVLGRLNAAAFCLIGMCFMAVSVAIYSNI